MMCGRGDCLFVRSRHGDKIMTGQRTLYYIMTSAKTHDWSLMTFMILFGDVHIAYMGNDTQIMKIMHTCA